MGWTRRGGSSVGMGWIQWLGELDHLLGWRRRQRCQVRCEVAAAATSKVWYLVCWRLGVLETWSEVFQNKREIWNQPLRLESRENREKNQTSEIDLKERERRFEDLEALRLREGSWLSGVRSKDSSWPWFREVEN